MCFRLLICILEDIASYLGRVTGYSFIVFHGFLSTSNKYWASTSHSHREMDVYSETFKYLGYRISEYKSYLEDKLQTYNKINGAIRRHFGKQMNKETRLRIHNITAKAALKFGSET